MTADRQPAGVVLLVGDTALPVSTSPAGEAVLDAMRGRRCTLVSGGTDAGVAALAAEIGRVEADVHTVGYVPAGRADLADGRYDEIRFTQGDDFSPLESLAVWEDIRASGLTPADVSVLGLGGGDISALEYRLALTIGARVGLIDGTGRAVDELFLDARWKDHPRLRRLRPDATELRAFLDDDVIERV